MSININQTTDNETPSTGLFTITGSLYVTNGIKLPNTGGAAFCGSVIINAGGSGTTVVSTTAVKADSIIILTPKNNIFGATPPYAPTSGITAGTSFTIQTDTVNAYQLYWVILQQS